MDAVPISKKLIAFGSKKIYLPKFTVAMVRAPGLSPYHARFLVPLDFSKYDLRDYLYHAYNVKCFNIRSYVKQMPIRDSTAAPRQWFRPESKKYMTVEMEQPFVWPELPEDTEPWGVGKVKSELDQVIGANDIVTMEQKRQKAKSLREQVKALLTKKDTRKPEDGVQEAQGEQSGKNVSALEFWEQKRTDKVVQGDESRRYAIKA
ncbi:hypothetical protein E8E13_009285 [Curvularia kusanoi]|uniref:Large ribosomal subunit protein uL23m n=1 Tax=Curvularia kusanoi TaxID=90978 RepID=A0A9P4W9I9_CURKU|nr:hypothetical protein E8E13_009285 [Curvularia kusanoi]